MGSLCAVAPFLVFASTKHAMNAYQTPRRAHWAQHLDFAMLVLLRDAPQNAHRPPSTAPLTTWNLEHRLDLPSKQSGELLSDPPTPASLSQRTTNSATEAHRNIRKNGIRSAREGQVQGAQAVAQGQRKACRRVCECRTLPENATGPDN